MLTKKVWTNGTNDPMWKECCRVVSAPQSNTTNLLNHLKKHHKLHYDECTKAKKRHKSHTHTHQLFVLVIFLAHTNIVAFPCFQCFLQVSGVSGLGGAGQGLSTGHTWALCSQTRSLRQALSSASICAPVSFPICSYFRSVCLQFFL